MADTDGAPGPLAFSACLPREEAYAVIAGELASKLAGSAKCVTGVAGEIRAAVEGAFGRALALDRPESETVDLVLRASDEAFSAELTCGPAVLLRWVRSRVD